MKSATAVGPTSRKSRINQDSSKLQSLFDRQTEQNLQLFVFNHTVVILPKRLTSRQFSITCVPRL